MPFVEADDILYLGIDGRHDGQQVLLTTHWKVFSISPGLNVDMNTLFTAWATELDAAGEIGNVYPDVLSEDVTHLRYIMQKLFPVRFVRFELTPAFTDGQVVEAALPPNVAHAITLRGDDANRNNIGTKHIGGVPTSFSENGLMTPAAKIVYEVLAEALIDSMAVTVGADTVLMEPLIFNRVAMNASPEATSYIVQDTTRVVRRRTVGLGS